MPPHDRESSQSRGHVETRRSNACARSERCLTHSHTALHVMCTPLRTRLVREIVEPLLDEHKSLTLVARANDEELLIVRAHHERVGVEAGCLGRRRRKRVATDDADMRREPLVR